MNILGLGDLIKGVGQVADDLITTDEERLKLRLEEKKLDIEEKKIDASLIKGQQEINKQEATHKSVFVAGWRPFVGWVCGFALFYHYIFYHLIVWIVQILIDNEVLTRGFALPALHGIGDLIAILVAMLGLGGIRSFDKLKKTDTKKIGK